MAVNYVLSLFQGNINPGYPTGIKLYLRSTKEIYKETDKLDTSVSNSKDIAYYLLSLAKKYVWVCLTLMVGKSSGAKNVFRVVEQVKLEEIQKK